MLRKVASSLVSRLVRINVSQGKSGADLLKAATGALVPRKISKLTSFDSHKDEQGNIITQLWNGARSLAGFVGGLIKGIAFSATAVWGWLIGRIEQIKSFDWNASDEALKKMMEQQNNSLASLWGGVVGAGFGWIAGITVGYGIGFLCPVIGGASLARAISTEVGKEAIEEVLPLLKNALVQTAGALANNALINVFMNYRRLLKSAPVGLLEKIYGKDGAQFIKQIWGNKEGPDMSFNHQMDEFVDSIGNQALQNFVEEFFDESWDSFTEAGFIIAHELDDAFAQHKASQKNMLGEERTIKLEVDTSSDDEVLTFAKVPQNLLIPAVQTTINTHRLMYGRDVGNIVATSLDTQLRARPVMRQLTIIFKSRPAPPWQMPNGRRCKEAAYSIPDVKRGLSWEQIKEACPPYTWGKFRATANLTNLRQMAVYGATKEEAEKQLRKLLTLSTAEILSLSISEEEIRPVGGKKEATEMWPAYATLIAKRNSIDGTGRVTLEAGTLKEKVKRFPLYPVTEPRNMPELD